MTSGAPALRAQQLGRREAVHAGHADVHQHDVGRGARPPPRRPRCRPLPLRRSRCPPRRPAASPARPARARRRRRPGRGSDRSLRPRQPGAEPEVAIRVVGRGRGCRPTAWRARRARRGPCRSRGSASRPPVRTGAGLRTSIVRPSPGAPSTRSSTAADARVLVRVRERLLDDAQRVSSDRVGHGRQIGDADVGVEVHAGGARVLEQRRAAPRASAGAAAALRRPCRRAARRSPRAGPRAPGGRWPGSPPRRAPTSSGGASGPELECAGVQAQERDPVGEHVVHLACDPRALGVARPARRAAAARRACDARSSRCALATAADETCPSATAPAMHSVADEVVLDGASRPAGARPGRPGSNRQLAGGDDQRRLPAAVGGDGEQDDQAGESGRGRTRRATGSEASPRSDRPAPAPPEREAERSAADHVDHEQRSLQPVVEAGHEARGAEPGRSDEQDAVDDPLTPASGGRAARRPSPGRRVRAAWRGGRSCRSA